MQTQTKTPQTATGMPQPQRVVVTEQQLVTLLIGYAKERKAALLVYPNAKGVGDKLAEIENMMYWLEDVARHSDNQHAVAKICLKQTLGLHFIAPRDNRKRFTDWYNKIENIMQAFRECLGWRKQV